MRIFHVSEQRIGRFEPRPSPPGTTLAGRSLVWAVDEERLPHYLLPRDCPRVCWVDATGRWVAVEQAWVGRIRDATLFVHELDPAPFRSITEWWGTDDPSGYWVSDEAIDPIAVEEVTDCAAAIASAAATLVVDDDLRARLAAVRHVPFSAIRMRNARTSG